VTDTVQELRGCAGLWRWKWKYHNWGRGWNRNEHI